MKNVENQSLLTKIKSWVYKSQVISDFHNSIENGNYAQFENIVKNNETILNDAITNKDIKIGKINLQFVVKSFEDINQTKQVLMKLAQFGADFSVLFYPNYVIDYAPDISELQIFLKELFLSDRTPDIIKKQSVIPVSKCSEDTVVWLIENGANIQKTLVNDKEVPMIKYAIDANLPKMFAALINRPDLGDVPYKMPELLQIVQMALADESNKLEKYVVELISNNKCNSKFLGYLLENYVPVTESREILLACAKYNLDINYNVPYTHMVRGDIKAPLIQYAIWKNDNELIDSIVKNATLNYTNTKYDWSPTTILLNHLGESEFIKFIFAKQLSTKVIIDHLKAGELGFVNKFISLAPTYSDFFNANDDYDSKSIADYVNYDVNILHKLFVNGYVPRGSELVKGQNYQINIESLQSKIEDTIRSKAISLQTFAECVEIINKGEYNKIKSEHQKIFTEINKAFGNQLPIQKDYNELLNNLLIQQNIEQLDSKNSAQQLDNLNSNYPLSQLANLLHPETAKQLQDMMKNNQHIVLLGSDDNSKNTDSDEFQTVI